MFTWIVTGAAGHLGGTIVRLLQERKAEVRGLVLPHESAADQGETRYFTGDVTLPETLVPLFEGTDPARTVVIHTAGLIDIGDRPYEELRRVNVEGTRNVLALCRQYGVRRLVYVSSVHAIAQDPDGGVLRGNLIVFAGRGSGQLRQNQGRGHTRRAGRRRGRAGCGGGASLRNSGAL